MKYNLEKKDQLEILENAMSWIVVFAMFIYGSGKWIQFEQSHFLDKTIGELTGMELMWAFYGHSKAFAITIGLLEIIGGFLILIKRTRIIGCLLTSTILVNVILQDIFYEVHVGALKAAVLYQLLIFAILWIHKDTLIRSLKTLLVPIQISAPLGKVLFKFGAAFVLFVVFRILEYYITIKMQ